MSLFDRVVTEAAAQPYKGKAAPPLKVGATVKVSTGRDSQMGTIKWHSDLGYFSIQGKGGGYNSPLPIYITPQ